MIDERKPKEQPTSPETPYKTTNKLADLLN